MSKKEQILQDKKIPKSVNISVPKGFEEEVKYLYQQPNKAYYIWNLVRQDMNKSNEENELVNFVKQAMINNSTFTNVNNNNQPTQSSNKVSEEKLKREALSFLSN